jgi:hypothetical protein
MGTNLSTSASVDISIKSTRALVRLSGSGLTIAASARCLNVLESWELYMPASVALAMDTDINNAELAIIKC